MTSVEVHQAKTQLSELLRRVTAGEEITITRAGEPIAKLVPIRPRTTRTLGQDRGLYAVSDDLDRPLPDNVVDSFER
ncbi:MAG: type II toxin-antitoxin system Phd/YefM family antitoxin [Acidimicrobiia bacterium]|nr:type II toxin-antitoxin system Phd/YefM family antitoxin [Acidimicrobiia bacterium]